MAPAWSLLGSVPFSDAARALLLAAIATLAMVGWMALRALRLPGPAPDRLIAELRLAQVSAVVLALMAGSSLGLAAAHEHVPGVGLEVAFALGFLVVAVLAPLRDPHEALLVLALAFLSHAVLDVLRGPSLLPEAAGPRWFAIGCAVHNVLSGAASYLPVLRR